MADFWRGFWTRETGTGQQVAQLHERYMMVIMMMMISSYAPIGSHFSIRNLRTRHAVVTNSLIAYQKLTQILINKNQDRKVHVLVVDIRISVSVTFVSIALFNKEM
jgi:hypothetical protein